MINFKQYEARRVSRDRGSDLVVEGHASDEKPKMKED